MTSSYSSSNYKKYDNFTVTDNFGNTYLFVRTGKDAKGNDRWFNIAKNEILTDGHIDENDGLVPDAVPFHPEEVAYLSAQHEEYQERLVRAESSLKQWIDFSKEWKKIPKRKRSLQKQEVAK